MLLRSSSYAGSESHSDISEERELPPSHDGMPWRVNVFAPSPFKAMVSQGIGAPPGLPPPSVLSPLTNLTTGVAPSERLSEANVSQAGMAPPGLSSDRRLASIGSAEHSTGNCKPCAFFLEARRLPQWPVVLPLPPLSWWCGKAAQETIIYRAAKRSKFASWCAVVTPTAQTTDTATPAGATAAVTGPSAAGAVSHSGH